MLTQQIVFASLQGPYIKANANADGSEQYTIFTISEYQDGSISLKLSDSNNFVCVDYNDLQRLTLYANESEAERFTKICYSHRIEVENDCEVFGLQASNFRLVEVGLTKWLEHDGYLCARSPVLMMENGISGYSSAFMFVNPERKMKINEQRSV